MTALTVLDVCCGVGGATRGYTLAGYDVYGVDIAEQPDYPGPMHRGDGIEYIHRHGHRYDFIHVSPPCQRKCTLTLGTNTSRGWGREHIDLLPAFREALAAAGRPHIIEQPDGQAEIRKDVTLCGEMFGLSVLRHRNFELGGWSTPKPEHVKHRGYVRGWRHGVYRDGPYLAAYGDGGGKATVDEMRDAMGIDWTRNRTSLTEAIPPAYTQWIAARMKTS
jgi:hypothetical protein